VAPNLQDLFLDGISAAINSVNSEGETPVTAALEGALAGLDITGPLGAIGSEFGTDLTADIADVVEDIWGFTAYANTAFGANASCSPPPETPSFDYSYRIISNPPVLGAGSIFGPYHLGLSIAQSAFNQLLSAVVECGVLSLSITELDPIGPFTGTIMSLLFPELAQFPLDTQYELRVRPLVAPVLTGKPGPSGSLVDLRLAGLELQLRDSQDLYGKLLDMVIDARAGLDMGVTDSELELSVVPPAANDIAVTVTRNEIGTDEQVIQDLFEIIAIVALPDLAGALGSFPLPDLEGLPLDAIGVLPQSKYISIFLNLGP
jgi:hypothetical protein